MQLHLPGLHVVGHAAHNRKEVRHLVAPESHAFGIRRNPHIQRLEAGILDLVLEICRDLQLRLGDGRVLEAGHLHPGIDLLDPERQAPGILQQTEGEHPFLADPRFLRIELGHAVARPHLKPHPLLRNDHQLPPLLPGLSEAESRHQVVRRRTRAQAGEVHAELLLPLSLALQLKRDDPSLGRLELRPVAERGPADALDIQIGGEEEAEPEDPRPRDLH